MVVLSLCIEIYKKRLRAWKVPKKDAQTWIKLFESYKKEKKDIVSFINSSPELLSSKIKKMEKRVADEIILNRYRFFIQSMRSWCNEYFESEEAPSYVWNLWSICRTFSG